MFVGKIRLSDRPSHKRIVKRYLPRSASDGVAQKPRQRRLATGLGRTAFKGEIRRETLLLMACVWKMSKKFICGTGTDRE